MGILDYKGNKVCFDCAWATIVNHEFDTGVVLYRTARCRCPYRTEKGHFCVQVVKK